MSVRAEHLKYSKSHEWVRVEGQHAVIGISEHAQELLGDLVYVELPDIGRKVIAGEETAVVESVKAASDVYSPIAGEVVEVNSALNNAPELVNQSPYEKGWLYKLTIASPQELEQLLSAEDYQKLVDAEEH